MKRQYIIPMTLVIQTECQPLLGASDKFNTTGLDGMDGYGGGASGKSADSRGSSYDFWEE